MLKTPRCWVPSKPDVKLRRQAAVILLRQFPEKPFMARALRQRVYEIELQAKYPKASGEVSGREQTCFTRNSPTLDSNGSANPTHFNAEPLRPKCLKTRMDADSR